MFFLKEESEINFYDRFGMNECSISFWFCCLRGKMSFLRGSIKQSKQNTKERNEPVSSGAEQKEGKCLLLTL